MTRPSSAPASDRFVLLIGAMKAGTTALFRYLAQHPELAPCREKEPDFLSDAARWREGLESYASLWEGWDHSRHRWALEASTGYSKLPLRVNAVQASFCLPAEFRFLYIVRDPLARIRSQYLHSLAEDWIRWPIHERLAPEAVLFSNYQFQLASYLSTHGRSSIHVVSYEALCACPAEVLRGICTFLEIDPEFRFTNPGRQNESQPFRTKLLARLAARARLLPASVDSARIASPQVLRAHLSDHLGPLGALECLAELDAELERSITPSEAQVGEIHALLDDDLARFHEEWGIDAWTGASAASLHLSRSA